MIKYILTISLLLTLCFADTFFFGRSLKCVQNNTIQCTQWNNSISLHHFSSYYYMCFPAQTFVMTPDGPKLLSDLQIHDMILSYNKETGKNHYSQVIAWLHRDTLGNLEFQQIQTKENYTFSASQSHNIGFIKNGSVDFKFAENLLPGQYLMSLGKNLTVSQTSELLEQEGLYSPMTQEGNFYIFAQGVNPSDIVNSPMILVHCLSQVNSPLSHESWVKRILHLVGYFGFNEHEREEDQNYIHPITHLLGFTGGKSEKIHKQSYYYRSDMKHLKGGRGGGGRSGGRSGGWGGGRSSRSWGSSRGYYGSGGSGYYYGAAGGAAYSSHNQQEQQNKRRQQSVMGLLMINEVLLKSS